jgi:hypothetical protein
VVVSSAGINYPAVVVAAVVHFILGAVWFWALMDPWLAGIGKTSTDMTREGSPVLAYVIAFGSNLVLAWVLSWAMLVSGYQSVGGGMMMGALLWLGFVATTTATEYVFEARSFETFTINAGYPLVGMLIMGALLGAWKQGHPVSSASWPSKPLDQLSTPGCAGGQRRRDINRNGPAR